MTNLFMGDDAYHGGAFMLNANFGFYAFFKPQENPQLPPKTPVPFDYGTKDAYEFYLKAEPIGTLSKYLEGKSALFDDQMRHDTYDEYWKARNLAPLHVWATGRKHAGANQLFRCQRNGTTGRATSRHHGPV